MLSFDEKKFVIEQWSISRSYTSIRRAFRSRPGYHAKNLPSISTIRNIVVKLRKFGTVHDRRTGKKSSIKDAEVKIVERMYRNKQLLSLRTVSRRMQCSTWKIRNILRLKLLKKAYKARVRMVLTERQRKREKGYNLNAKIRSRKGNKTLCNTDY